jgi:integrase
VWFSSQDWYPAAVTLRRSARRSSLGDSWSVSTRKAKGRAETTRGDEPRSSITFERFLTSRWLPVIERTVRPSTFTSYRTHVVIHVVPRIGRTMLRALDAPALNSLYAELLVEGRAKGVGGLSPSTVRRIHATVHRALRDAVRWGHLEVNPADRCDPPRQQGHDARSWSPQELRAFLEAVRDDELHALWHFLALTGVRRGEALGLRWENVDLRSGRAAITQTLVIVGSVVQRSEPKTRRARRVIALDELTTQRQPSTGG